MNAYNILTLSQLSPYSWGGIIVFQVLCKMIDVRPTLTLWSHMYKMVEMMAGENEPGWCCFQVRQRYQTVLNLPSSQKGFQREFAFVYFSEKWEVPTVQPDVEPKFGHNFRVLTLSEEEE